MMEYRDYKRLLQMIYEAANTDDITRHLLNAIENEWPDLAAHWNMEVEATNNPEKEI
jgi:hypothetical protein